MSLSSRHRFLATSTKLIARQKATIAKYRNKGWSEHLAQSLLSELETAAHVVRNARPAASSKRSCRTITSEMLEPSFLISMSRELKNHLQCLMSNLDVALRLPQGSVDNAGALQEIEGVLSLINLLGDDLIMAAETQGSERNWSVQPRSVAQLVEKVVAALVPAAGLAEVVLHVAPISKALEVRCNWDRTLYALTQLTREALKTTRCGGRVTFAARRSQGMVRFSLTSDPAHVAESAEAVASGPRPLRCRLAASLIEAQRGSVWSGEALGRNHRTYVELPAAVKEPE